MSVAPNPCCDETKNRGTYTRVTIGTWNVRSMNQGKFGVVKQELARVNIDILGISEQKWTGMGEFNSDDHYTYYCGDRVAIIVKAREFQNTIYFIDYAKAFNCVDQNKRWKILKEMGIPDHLYLSPEKPVCRTRNNS